ncbi:hypothetical protein AB0E08_08245 [Streptomyces sp. NPDC048281]|uniref:hypothetical protein n=1 Tax=Streptomyces sp. NPDC048281 TaxID=3154715 RepID=UPI003438CA50
MTPLTAGQLREMLGEPADTWPAQGLTVTEGDGRTEVHQGEVLIGWIEDQDYPHLQKILPLYSAVITTFPDGSPWGVAFPGGFLPPDPLHARQCEQIRWLPADHPDRPNGAK